MFHSTDTSDVQHGDLGCDGCITLPITSSKSNGEPSSCFTLQKGNVQRHFLSFVAFLSLFFLEFSKVRNYYYNSIKINVASCAYNSFLCI